MAKDDKTKVTRISASDDIRSESDTVKKPTKKTISAKTVKTAKPKRTYGRVGKIGGYFKGAWYELRQVHWPTRRATWGLTGAVLLFSAFFVVFITLLDAGFKFMFEQILR